MTRSGPSKLLTIGSMSPAFAARRMAAISSARESVTNQASSVPSGTAP
jgi:hypothetical protein